MINFNGNLVPTTKSNLPITNRGFKFGDGLFETIKHVDGKTRFMEDHYFRLMASMRMLRMEIPMNFTLEHLEEEIHKTVLANQLHSARVRMSVFRAGEGLYAPNSNAIHYVIEVNPLTVKVKNEYEVDIFKDFTLSKGLISSIKTTNRIINVLAGIYAKENELDNCVLINDSKYLAEFISGNLFAVFGNVIKTPPITEGCIKGVMRKKVCEIIQKSSEFMLEESPISPFELQKADELFMTNAIIDIQPITKYRKKQYATSVAEKLQEALQKLV